MEIEILLVEDDPSDAELALRVLRKGHMGHGILHVRDGEEALEYLFATGKFEGRNINQIPKVIFLDLKMPKVGGLEVLQRIKADERTRTIPVVLFTSSKEEKDVIDGYRLGANSYIVKPMTYEDYSESVLDTGSYWLNLNCPPSA
jgi:two-component system, response regulator